MTDNASQDRDMSGALFRERERQSDRHPEMTGYVVIGGIRYRLAGWTREGRSGQRYLSIRVSPDRVTTYAASEQAPPTTVRSVDELAAARSSIPTGVPSPSSLPPPGDLDDAIPF